MQEALQVLLPSSMANMEYMILREMLKQGQRKRSFQYEQTGSNNVNGLEGSKDTDNIYSKGIANTWYSKPHKGASNITYGFTKPNTVRIWVRGWVLGNQVFGFPVKKKIHTIHPEIMFSIQGNSGPMVLQKCLALATCIVIQKALHNKSLK